VSRTVNLLADRGIEQLAGTTQALLEKSLKHRSKNSPKKNFLQTLDGDGMIRGTTINKELQI
jgi:hypothetical protein